MDNRTLTLDGVEYQFPTLDSITMDEAILFERYAGAGIETLQPGTALPLGAVKALMVVAVMRVRKDATEQEISTRIGSLALQELSEVFTGSQGDPLPPPSAPESDESGESSGADGTAASDATPASLTPPSFGAQPSDTGSISGHLILDA